MNVVRDRAWWVLAAFSLLLVMFGVSDMAAGADADPGIALGLTGLSPAELRAENAAAYRMFDFTVRTQAMLLIVAGVLFLAILLRPYRTRQSWAWRLMWLLPAWSLSVPAVYLAFGLSPDQAPPPPLVSGPILGIVAALALLLDRTRFAGSVVSRPASGPVAAR